MAEGLSPPCPSSLGPYSPHLQKREMSGTFGGCHEDELERPHVWFLIQSLARVAAQYLLVPTLPSPPKSLSILSPKLELLS